MQENPWAYNEARNRIREKQEQERITIEKKKDEFEIGKEKIYTRKKLDVFELKRKIETGHSLASLKEDIRSALESGDISPETYEKVIDALHHDEHERGEMSAPLLDPNTLPFSQNRLAQYLEQKKLGENIAVDMIGFAYGFAQGSVFLIYILGRLCIDALLLPRDIYQLIQSK